MHRRPLPPHLAPVRTAIGLALAAALALLAAPPRAAHADPILYEVCYDGDGTDADEAFTEIFGTAGLSLEGWTLQGVNGGDGTVYRSIALDGLTIPSDGLLVLATSSATGAVLAARDATREVDWQNGPDAVRLLNALGVVVDALQYGDAGTYGAGEGSYATDVGPGWSLSRDLWATDTDDNATDWVGLSDPTPGVGPSLAPVPEPASGVLLATGGLALAAVRRRRRRLSPGPPDPAR